MLQSKNEEKKFKSKKSNYNPSRSKLRSPGIGTFAKLKTNPPPHTVFELTTLNQTAVKIIQKLTFCQLT